MYTDGKGMFDSVQGSYRKVVNTVMPIGGSVVAMMLKMKKQKKKKYALGPMAAMPEAMPIMAIPVSARLQESYTYQSEATRLSVETGVQLTDHVILSPIRIDLTFMVSNIDEESSGSAIPNKVPFSGARTALAAFVDCWQKRIPLTLITTHAVIEDMVCINLQADNTVPEWGKLQFRATFQQIKYVSLGSDLLIYPKVAETGQTAGPAASLSAAAPANNGESQVKSVDTKAALFPTVNQAVP